MKASSKIADEAFTAILSSERVVAVVGAGVSTEVGIPSGEGIKKAILGDRHYGPLVRNVCSSPANAGFFEMLDAYRDVVEEDRFWSFIDGHMKHGKEGLPISESYELLAHLYHHRAVAAIISLNFDEVLDKAISLEMRGLAPTREIVPVAGRSEFSALADRFREDRVQGRRYPLERRYLKPHGTISRRLTMRFGRDRVKRFERGKRRALRAYLNGAAVLVLGWRLGDPDLVRLLNGSARPSSAQRIIVVRSARKAAGDLELDPQHFLVVRSGASTYLRQLSEYRAQRQRTALPAGYIRHSIRAAVFRAPQGKGDRAPAPDVRNQLALEILMNALKARGHFELETLLECPRVVNLIDGLEPKAAAEGLATTLAGLTREYGGNSVLVRSVNPVNGSPVYWLRAPMGLPVVPDRALATIAEVAVRAFANYLGLHHSNERIQHLQRHAQTLTNVFDIDINPDVRRYAMFLGPDPVSDGLRFQSRTEDVLKAFADSGTRKGSKSEALELWISSYTGEWLIRPPFADILKQSRGLIKLLVDDYDVYSDSPYRRIAESRVEEVSRSLGDRLQRRKVSPKIHNMTVLVNRRGEFVCGLYFRREAKTTQVSPVFLDGREDMKSLRGLWEPMWKGGGQF